MTETKSGSSNKIICCMAIHGREKLLEYTLKNLLEQNLLPHKIILIGDCSPELKSYIKRYSLIELIECTNAIPLGKKWQISINYSKKYEPDGILILGSDDFLVQNYIMKASEYLPEYDLIGQTFFYIFTINRNKTETILLWNGYDKKLTPHRYNEPIGAGRIFSKKILDTLNWKIFEDKNSCLDYISYQKVTKLKGKIKILDENLYCIGLSHYRYEYKHNKTGFKTYPTVSVVQNSELQKLAIFRQAINEMNLL